MSNLRHRRAQRIRDLADMGKTRREVASELFMSYATVVNYGRQFGIKFRHASKGVGVDEDRADAMEAMFRAGKTLEEIGSVYGISRERVRQIISKYLSPGDDPVTTADRDEAAHILASLFTLIGVKVVEFNPVEGWSRDVTADFEAEEDEYEVAGEHPRPVTDRQDGGRDGIRQREPTCQDCLAHREREDE